MASQQLKRNEEKQDSLKNGGVYLSQIYQLSLGSPEFCKILGTLFAVYSPAIQT